MFEEKGVLPFVHMITNGLLCASPDQDPSHAHRSPPVPHPCLHNNRHLGTRQCAPQKDPVPLSMHCRGFRCTFQPRGGVTAHPAPAVHDQVGLLVLPAARVRLLLPVLALLLLRAGRRLAQGSGGGAAAAGAGWQLVRVILL